MGVRGRGPRPVFSGSSASGVARRLGFLSLRRPKNYVVNDIVLTPPPGAALSCAVVGTWDFSARAASTWPRRGLSLSLRPVGAYLFSLSLRPDVGLPTVWLPRCAAFSHLRTVARFWPSGSTQAVPNPIPFAEAGACSLPLAPFVLPQLALVSRMTGAVPCVRCSSAGSHGRRGLSGRSGVVAPRPPGRCGAVGRSPARRARGCRPASAPTYLPGSTALRNRG